MLQQPIHYELYLKRRVNASWILSLATEDRDLALHAANALMVEKDAVAVKVTKETLNEETRNFRSSTIFIKGEVDIDSQKTVVEDKGPICTNPSDLYTLNSRETIGRIFENWLNRNGVTTFELMHRPDLADQLEASSMDMQGAIQKISIPEAQRRGVSVHEVIRYFHSLSDRTFEHLRRNHRNGRVPEPDAEGFAQTIMRLYRTPDAGYLLGGTIAAHLAPVRNWTQKIDYLLNLANNISDADLQISEDARLFAFSILEQPLAEIMGSKRGLSELLGDQLNMGQRLAAMTRLTVPKAVDRLIKMEPAASRLIPPLHGTALRLAEWLRRDIFVDVRAAIGRQILRDLKGSQRLSPDNPNREVEMMRALAMALTFGSGNLMNNDSVKAAFVIRSRILISPEFVSAYLGNDKNALEEASALIFLLENVIGKTNKHDASLWLRTSVDALKFERGMVNLFLPPRSKLQELCRLQSRISRAGLAVGDELPLAKRIGEVGGLVEADSKYIAAITKAQIPPSSRLVLLMALSVGDAGPSGPVADRAKAEAMKLLRLPDVRKEVATSSDIASAVKRFLEVNAPDQATPNG